MTLSAKMRWERRAKVADDVLRSIAVIVTLALIGGATLIGLQVFVFFWKVLCAINGDCG